MTPLDEIILDDLTHLPIWVAWREEQRNGDATKVPYNPRTGREAKSTDSATWATRGEAETWAIINRGGVGIVLSQINGGDCCLCGIDLDTCRDPNKETFQDWAQEVIDRFSTYTEVSPSRTGAKLLFTYAAADIPAVERLFNGHGGRQFKNGGGKHCPAIEVYRTGRYFTVTDESIGPTDILRQASTADLEWLIRDAGPKFAHKENQKSGSDQSRSGKAFRKGAALKAAGHSYDAMRGALLADEDLEIAAWARTKGLANGERELHRVYGNAGDADARPKEKAPYADAPITPIMRLLDEKLSTAAPEPPMRNIVGQMAMVRVRKPRHQSLHELAPDGSETRLAPAIMPLLTEHDETSLAILIERHINFEKVIKTKIGETRVPVSLCRTFVRDYHRYADSTLPVAHAIATLPLVLANGKLIAPNGLDRDLGIIFRIDPRLAAILPRPAGVTREDVKAAIKFLTDEWLVDVTATFASKCVLIAMALTVIERTVLLTGRPAFFITAAKRGGGKTTAAHMVSMAALGIRAVAAAWSPSEEERRKAMLAYLSEGVPLLVFDNIHAGATISSAVIEALLTSGECSDRILGVTKTLHTAISTIVNFTGNNIAPCGDLSSRCLIARIDVDRPDPEHRKFMHPFPLDWTTTNRGKILAALYTIMLGDPEVGKALNPSALHTRFSELLATTEVEDETAMNNVEVLMALSRKWASGQIFEAADVAEYCKLFGDAPSADVALLRDYFDPRTKPGDTVSPKKIGRALGALMGSPFRVGNGEGTIRLVGAGADKHSKVNGYKIERIYPQ